MTASLPQLTRLDRRLVQVGFPLLVSNGALLALPVLARAFLGPTVYATWALLMTVVTAAFLFDLGGSAFIQSAGYGVRVGRRLYLRSVGLACAGVAVVTATALIATLLLGDSLDVGTSRDDLAKLIVATGLGAAARSTWTVMLSRLQVAESFMMRARLAIAQSLVQLALCWLALAAGLGLWSLSLGLILSAVPFLVVSHLLLRRMHHSLPPARPSSGLLGFASVRTLAAVIGTASSQADRWVLAAIAPATFLTNYDLALRFAALPLSVVVTLFTGLVAETAATPGTTARRKLVRGSTLRLAALTAVLSVAGYLGLMACAALGAQLATTQMMTILAMALVWMGTNALTAPTSMAFIGAGKPAYELLYTGPALLCCVGGWAAAVALSNPWLVPVVTLMAVTSWSLWFVYYGTHRARF